MIYMGSDTAVMIVKPEDGNFAVAFIECHLREFGFSQAREIGIDDARVRSIGKSMDIPIFGAFDQLDGSDNFPIAELSDSKVRGPAAAIDATSS
ncbi:hypothetical protein F5Y19DRAFT_478917 [Xylariaceae sp. FL1651]|nr:hypothetical protein F5Y19DRAFT_478917 [Xylariaceae sp. FL1651]